MPQKPSANLATICALSIGALGAVIAIGFNVPAGALVGPACAVTIAGFCGIPLQVPMMLRNACFLAIGIELGSGVTREALSQAASWPLSLVMIVVLLCAIMIFGGMVCHRWFGFTRAGGIMASTPGHLSFVLSLAVEKNIDTTRIAIIQSIRVLFITLVLPPAILFFWPEGNHQATMIVRQSQNLLPLGIQFILAGGFGWWMWARKWPAAFILSGIALSSTFQLANLTTGNMPDFLILPAFVALGTLIGSRFEGVSWKDFTNVLLASIINVVLALSLAAICAQIIATVLGISIIDAMIAFVPGGLESMAAIAITMDADITYVGTHHLFRVIAISFVLPIVLRLHKD